MRWPKIPGRDSRYEVRGDTDISSWLDWPASDAQTMENLTNAVDDGTVDEAALPYELAAKRIRLGHSGQPYPSMTRREAFTWRTWRSRLRYSRSERRALRAALITWPASRAELSSFANCDVLEAEWDTRFPHSGTPHPGAAALVWCHANVVAIASTLTSRARDARIWKSELMDEYGVRIDLDAVMRDIATRAYRLWRNHADTHLSLGIEDQPAWDELIDLIDTLLDYELTLHDRMDRLQFLQEVLDLDDVDDKVIAFEFGCDPDEPVNRAALRETLQTELKDHMEQLASILCGGSLPLAAPSAT
ncbi:hypothetical protein JF729_06795 [Mycobacterium intracellulare]|uniref:hypothetical protein n=1 Tax=Mycobacterium intracellulare TaxID=1767 RepID=UPI001CD97BD1|nr:hypothetical protein [Mycobacterium intracellulare]MCA2247503.1 hypothetical protein [Mycobacterium intracellulare]